MSATPPGLERLSVFVRAPRPGAVKTRLAEGLGAEGAARAYRLMVSELLGQLAGLPHLELRYTPDDGQAEVSHWLRPGWVARPQGLGDLGARMNRAFLDMFADGSARTLLIGSDCPSISIEDLQRAWALLREADVVLGPAVDGGYWLIGLTAPQPALFEGMTWSTHTVLSDTLNRARKAGLSSCLLRELTDIDTPEDWAQFLRSSPGARDESFHPVSQVP